MSLRRRGVGIVGVALGLSLAACGGSGYEYVSNDEAGIFFKVPDDWSVIDVDTDDGTLGRPGVPLDWVRVVDSSSAPTVTNYRTPVPADPVGIAVVEPVETASQRDALSLEMLRTYALSGYVAETDAPVDPLALNQEADGPLEMIDGYDINLDGGFHGQRIVFDLEIEPGQVVTIDQTALVDPETTEVYRLLIKCEAHCYADRRAEIDDIVDSWTIDQEA
ncbi:MAG TPA: hypothetical protein VIT24_12245 [Acidimicrobiales bacterium]|jgi:hypothetical protein